MAKRNSARNSAPDSGKNPSPGLEHLRRNPYPKQIIIDIHSYCNARCTICPYGALWKKLSMGVMEESLFKKIIDDFSGLARKFDFKGHVLFCNMGELFVYPKIVFDRIGYVLSSGLNFDIQTNAGALAPKMVDYLIDVGFNGSFVISCHGISPPVYHRIMGLSLPVTLRNINYLCERYPREKLGIQSIPHGWPRGEARRVRAYWRERDVGVRMPLPNDRAGLLPGLPGKRLKTLTSCVADRPLGEMVVCFNGDVILCCNDMARKEKIGSLREQSIGEVWNGARMTSRLEWIYGGRPSPPDFICKRCEFGVASNSPSSRFGRNIRHELRKFFYSRIW